MKAKYSGWLWFAGVGLTASVLAGIFIVKRGRTACVRQVLQSADDPYGDFRAHLYSEVCRRSPTERTIVSWEPIRPPEATSLISPAVPNSNVFICAGNQPTKIAWKYLTSGAKDRESNPPVLVIKTRCILPSLADEILLQAQREQWLNVKYEPF